MTDVIARMNRGDQTAAQVAALAGCSDRTVRRWMAVPRNDWERKMAVQRERIRAYHDDQGHSWPQTAEHFGLHVDTVKRRAYRARKERAAEAEHQAS